MDLRHLIDLNPKAGDSWQGLTRQQAKTLATTLILFALWMMIPPIIPEPTDFLLNIPLGSFIQKGFGFTPMISLALTYTIIPWAIFLLGIWIYPANSRTIFNGYLNKLKRYIKRLSKKPLLIFVLIVISYYVFQWYESILVGMI